MQVLTGGVSPQFGGRGGRRGLTMGPLSSTVMTSYRLHIVTIGLSLTVFTVLQLVTDGIGLAKDGTMH